MHPHTFYSNHFDLNKRNEVFVIMSFGESFAPRWDDVIKPVIEEDMGMIAIRVDERVSGESVVHDILDGIANARLVLADITSIQMTDSRGKEWPQRNANVMWEVGIAHTMRLPDEVLMVRSDDKYSIFDLTQFRAFEYDPSDAAKARNRIHSLAVDRLKSIDLSKHRKVQEAIWALDGGSMQLMLKHKLHDEFWEAPTATMGEAIVQMSNDIKAGFRTLLSLGIIRFKHTSPANGHVYCWTDFGKAVLLALHARPQ